MAQPNPIYGLMTVLLACVVDQLDATTRGAPCEALVTEADVAPPPLDLGDCCGCPGTPAGEGTLVGWWSRVHPSTTFPLESDDLRKDCANAYALEASFRLTRCAVPVADDGTVDKTALALSADRQLEDMYTMLRALRCCEAAEVLIQQAVPFTEGNCSGSTVDVKVQFFTPEPVI